jgi:EmrB/QacA subfamily drug resistance transporter
MTSKRIGFIVFALALGSLMASLDNTIASASISRIIADINGFDQISWIFTAYTLASTSTMLVFGKLSDIFGRKLFYLGGISIFLVGSALCGMAQDMTQLVIFRAIQGIGSGALFPIGFTILFTIAKDPNQAARMSGIFAGIFGLSSIAGPQIGTFIAEHWGWRWCFYVNLPVGLVAFATLLFALRESRSEDRPKIDYLGTITLIITTVSLMLALEWGGRDYAWGSWQILSLFAAALVFGILFVRIEAKAEEPVLPLVLFKNRMVLGMMLACWCQGAIMFSDISYLPILSTAILGNADSNSLLTPLMFSLMVGAVLFGALQRALSYRVLIALNMTMGVVVSYLLSTVTPDASGSYILMLMILLGALVIGPLMSMAQNAVAISVDPKYIGISSSIVGFWRNIGGVLGASITATIVNNNFQHAIESGADKLKMSADQLQTLAKPEQLIQVGSSAPQEVVDFIRDSLSAAINHGFVLGIAFGAVGLLAAIVAGPGRFNPPAKETEQDIPASM